MMCGGLGDTKPADDNIHTIVKNVLLLFIYEYNF